MRTEIAKLQSQVTAQTPTSPGKPVSFFCNGCGYTFQRDGRRIPCETSCVFEDHQDHNSGYKTGVPWQKDKKRLFWGTPEEYLRKHGKEMPERGKAYLEARAKFAAKRKHEQS